MSKPEPWFEQGHVLVQAVTFDMGEKYPLGVLLLSINNTPGMTPIERITRDPEGLVDFPVMLAAEGRDCWAHFSVGRNHMSVALGSNLGERVGTKIIEPS